MRYADLEAHGDLGLGADEPGTRRFTRPSDRMAPKPVDSHVTEGDPSGMDLESMFDAIEAAVADLVASPPRGVLLRTEALAQAVAPLIDGGQVQTEGFDVIHRALRRDASVSAADAVLKLAGRD